MVDKKEAKRLLECFFAFGAVEAWLSEYSVCHTWAGVSYFREFIEFSNSAKAGINGNG